MKHKGPKVLLIDVETAPILAHVWGLFDQNVGLNQIKEDWHMLSFAAKWLGEPDKNIIYADQSKEKDISNDKKLLEKVWKLLDEADVVISHSGRKFDVKTLNARFAHHGLSSPSSFKQVDTCSMARKHFRFTSYKLEFLTSILCKKHKKSKHKKYPGHELWNECLAGNSEAWKEMKHYNIKDVLAMEELYNILRVWDNPINPNIYTEEGVPEICDCGATLFVKNGFAYTAQGKFQRFLCNGCGCEVRAKQNLLSREKLKDIKIRVNK